MSDQHFVGDGVHPLTPISNLPSDLAMAIAHEGGGRVVLVVGAGVSVEAPTSLPSGTAVAIDAHRRLVADGVLQAGRCELPDDLSVVADTVVEVSGSQHELVVRLPGERFIAAQPNDGHLLAAALLREWAISSVLTLNFDLAFTNALLMVGANTDVAQVRGPEDQARLSSFNLVYLHRTAHHPADEWILTTDALTTAWTDTWEHAIASRVLAAPVVVFAGLGSPAAVLTETARRLVAVLVTGVHVYQVDVIPHAESAFAAQLGLGAADYLQLGWIEFMRSLASRFIEEQATLISQACGKLAQDNGWAAEDVDPLCREIVRRGLIELGQVRARWMLEETPYLPGCLCDRDHVADVLLVVRMIERQSGTAARIHTDGVVEFWDADRLRWALAFVSARGKWAWTALEPRVARARLGWRERMSDVRTVVVTGSTGPNLSVVSAPSSIVAASTRDDIITGAADVSFVDAHSLRAASAAEVEEFLNA